MPRDAFRNISIIGCDGAGKTALAEAFVRVGAPERGGKLDFEPEENKRNFSVTTHVTFVNWKGTTINVLDTPGFSNFLAESANMMGMTEASLLVFSATGGMKHMTERFWFMAEDLKQPLAFFINQMDIEDANFDKAVKEIEDEIKNKLLICQIPIGSDNQHRGIIDLLSNKAYFSEGAFGKLVEKEIPANLADDAATYRMGLIESIAECDDDMLAKYLEGTEPTQEELEKTF
ncbi:MAG: GTP-binding protein, partial [Myxococcota bacterium]